MRKELFKTLIDAQKELIHSLESEINTYYTSADLDEESTLDLDDMAQQANTSEQIVQMRKKLDMEKEDLQKMRSMEFLESNEIKRGAFVETSGAFFFFGYAFQPLAFKDKKLIGVSPEAPVYERNLGKKAGEKLQLNDNEMEINAIY